jgi:hypothetical protein
MGEKIPWPHSMEHFLNLLFPLLSPYAVLIYGYFLIYFKQMNIINLNTSVQILNIGLVIQLRKYSAAHAT